MITMQTFLHQMKGPMSTALIEQITLGIIQGIAEWLPISSEGMLLLAKTAIFNSKASLETMIGEALFLHAGSAAAAIIYFRKDIVRLCRSAVYSTDRNSANQKLIRFLFISTLISGILGLILLKNLSIIVTGHHASSRIILFIIGVCLLATAGLQLAKKQTGRRSAKDLTRKDSIILGIVQAFATLPGLSRSGLTIAALLLRKFNAPNAVRISFLMSIPIVLIGNIVMNITGTSFHIEQLAGLAASFIFSIMTIHVLLKAAQKINFGFFVLAMGLLVILSAFFPSF